MKMASLSPEMMKNWDKTGRNDFMKQCIKLIKDENKSLVFEKSGGISNIVSLINDLILNGVRGSMKKEAVVTTLQELVTLHNDIPSVILDILNIADAETLSAELQGGDHSKDRTNFCYVVKECEKFLSDKLLKERLEIDTLQEVGILKNRNFYTKFIKVKTKLYYKQRKFNLFREESEGFAKLVTELNQTFSTNTTHVYLLDIVQSLIGCFNLDPNRVLDIILESFENKPKDSALFIPLIRSYMSDPKTICEVLGSKFTLQRSNSVTSKSLYILTAQLLQHKIIKLDDIYIWLSPEDKSVQKQCERELREAKEYVRRLQIISINQAAESSGSTSGGATAATSSSNTTSGGGNSNSSGGGGGTDVLGETVEDRYRANQKLGVCEALLEIGDWRTAQELMARMPEHYAVEQQPIALALCRLIHEIVEPVYRRNWKLGTTIPKPPTNIPQLHLENPLAPKPAETFLDLRTHAFPMLLALGPTLRYDSVLMYKIIRIGRASIHLTTGGGGGTTNTTNHNDSTTLDTITTAENNEDTIYHDMITILDRTILPSLSYLDSNCSIAEEIWSLLKLYPYQSRYCLYSRWKNETHAAYPELLRKRGDAEKQIKNIMKRVSKENIKPVGRFIGKLTHSSPGFLFDYILLQIQVYDNLIHPVVDSLKYLTSLSYDVLGYCLIESLANADKKRVKHDSTSISNWLQSLSGFCGAVFKKYNIELTGLLQYVANQLKAQKSLDLLILKEIVQKMAGIEAAEDLTVEQLNAMSGGELLKVEAGYFSQVRNTKKSSLRLKEAMADQNLAVALCLLISQQKYCVVYRETQRLSHLKLVGKLSDQCQDTLVQFGTFLAGTFSVDEYVKKLPSIQTMLLEYHIPNEVAFFLARPMFNHAITKKYDELRKEDPNYKKMSTVSKHQKYYEAVTAIMTPIHSSVIPLHQPKIWEDISPQFLTTFWSLTMYDLHVPDDTYIQAVNKIKQQSLSNMDSNGGSGGGGGGNTSKSKKEQERYITLMEKLQEERRKQQEHVDKVLFRLKQEKDNWFMSRPAKSAKNETITRFLQLCIFPRCTFTAIDAVFCAKFVHTLHVLKTANFSTLLCYDRLFCDITYSVVSCTENEAMRYGRFLYSMLETVMRWHGSKDIFDRECANYPGFVTKYRVCNLLCENLDHIGYENFRHVCHKWHYKLARSMISCISSKEYLQIRNALIVLIKIIPFYPVLTNLAQTIEKKVTKMRDEEKSKRQDLFTLAVSYLGQLKQKVQMGHTLPEKDFHVPSEKPGSKANSSGTALTVATTTTTNGKHNGDSNKEPAESHHQKDKETSRDKDKSERKTSKATVVDDGGKNTKTISFDNNSFTDKTAEKEKSSKEGGGGSRDWQSRKEEKKEENSNSDRDRERDREKRRERKEEKMLIKEERQYREERFVEAVHKSPKDEMRYSSDRDRYYEERRDNSHYYREPRGGGGEDREVGNGNGGGSGGGSFSKHGVESAEPDRDVKRRKTDSQTSKSYAKQQSSSQQSQQQEEPPRKSSSSSSQQQLSQEYGSSSSDKNVSNVAPILTGGGSGGGDKKERSSKMKEKRSEKFTDEEKEQRKEKKLTRKRDRGDDAALLLAEQHKKRRDEEKALAKIMHQNGELIESPHSKDSREKHHHSREKSPYLRERSHDRVEQRDKHRRPTESKRR